MQRLALEVLGTFIGAALATILFCLATDAHAAEGSMAQPSDTTLHSGVNVGDMAPDFTLPRYPAGDYTLSASRGHEIVILYFYPADNTPVCTKQAEAFRDRLNEFADYGARIYGVSSDTLESHADFAKQYKLPFGLLSDAGGEVRALYGMPDGMDGYEERATYVIDKQGKVRHIIVDAEDVDKHINEALNWARQLALAERPARAGAAH
jgi:peroxiredoxin Q/BCP